MFILACDRLFGSTVFQLGGKKLHVCWCYRKIFGVCWCPEYIWPQQGKMQYFYIKNSFGCTHELLQDLRGTFLDSRQDGSVTVRRFRFTSRYSCLSTCPAEVCCFASQTALRCKHFGSYQPCQEAGSLLLCLYIKLYSENGNIWNTNGINIPSSTVVQSSKINKKCQAQTCKVITPLKAPYSCGSISIFYNYTMQRTVSGKSVCANPEEGINEKQSFLCVDNGVPLMYKQKMTAFLCFFYQEPCFPHFC